ncbi:uncharacterized protein OCT59_001630 [Rhizophagus irregularis]|uniref:Uncharacterized protein n=2 Tax=Rhizophagus irregularis TaxID=588596 RepID=U9U2L0_RHIID|nr:hypothetical protein GLOIN_2v1476036 [Rhizophagus irregularis DAOM 181602=DAOM 197198]EXX68044.1 hypothetical protein RirG_108660 [Rhizophagus irregularis DAOM 197198w]POG74685.1 hypothetical protein GLOIN_2v1476036 [Rhizophagus irregularis DAOM 181602=DAOM 197198]UZO10032.1 hypothetical protein OCT59_001630 [Rhizophagus irregularis]GBC41375.1 kinase-like domain-containing protein [Rhizophagus irregularis DAOM 181602=DAOM 197198]|eukprot:XP_025181551.1 hypothetical protein GLOIN_2v1476036 [Rhizophagus irregularis DAOM 181602=DAOM 197198]
MNVKKSTKYVLPLFKVPFPPELTVEEILSSRSDDRLKSKAPNRYLIYRLAFLKELRKRTDENVSMTKISSYISSMWFNETTSVRDAYEDLSKQVENRLTEIRQKEKLVLINESSSLGLQDNSPSGITDNNVVNPNYIPVFSDLSYQFGPPHLYFPSYIQIPDYSYQFSTSVDNFFNFDNYSIEPYFCEVCFNNFVNYVNYE